MKQPLKYAWMLKYQEYKEQFLHNAYIRNSDASIVTVEDILYCMDELEDVSPITFKLVVRHESSFITIPFKECMSISTFLNDYTLLDSMYNLTLSETNSFNLIDSLEGDTENNKGDFDEDQELTT